MQAQSVIDTANLSNHPYIRLLEQQKQTSLSRYNLERSKLLPDLFVAYNNMTMRGTGADNKDYTSSTRFQSAQVGIGIPLFFGAQKAKINAQKINQALTQSNYEVNLQNIQLQYNQSFMQYNKALQAVGYYEKTGLTSADTIISAAQLQYTNGEIGYLEWVMLNNQAFGLQNEYLDAVNNLNQSVIELNSLLNR
jgi:cobalt-zinc-cadmium resistance protein CzcA